MSPDAIRDRAYRMVFLPIPADGVVGGKLRKQVRVQFIRRSGG
jgi:hypothetical protein